MDNKQINLQTMCEMSDEELSELLEGLRSIEGFTFFVNCQERQINNKNCLFELDYMLMPS
jgi:hypothetical protein